MFGGESYPLLLLMLVFSFVVVAESDVIRIEPPAFIAMKMKAKTKTKGWRWADPYHFCT
jgi:hypothetical protein